MKKPEKPTKKIVQNRVVNYDFNFASKKVSLDSFLEWCLDTIPEGVDNVTIELVENWEYDDCITYLQLGWEEKVTNVSYKKDLDKYKKKLVKWEKQCQTL